jgi:hypothetical protein
MNCARIYIAGPMRGHPWYNFPAFNKAAESLIREGWEVFNPAAEEINRGYCPFDHPDQDWDKMPIDLNLRDIVRIDLEALQQCTAIYLLTGWEKSEGARAEYCVAKWLGLDIFGDPGYVQGMVDFDVTAGFPWENVNPPVEVIVSEEDCESILDEATRLTGGDRQNQYGPPDQDFARTAEMWSALKGVKFDPWEVAAFQICIKLSRQTHQRKRDNWVDVAGYAHCGNVCDTEAERRAWPGEEL